MVFQLRGGRFAQRDGGGQGFLSVLHLLLLHEEVCHDFEPPPQALNHCVGQFRLNHFLIHAFLAFLPRFRRDFNRAVFLIEQFLRVVREFIQWQMPREKMIFLEQVGRHALEIWLLFQLINLQRLIDRVGDVLRRAEFEKFFIRFIIFGQRLGHFFGIQEQRHRKIIIRFREHRPMHADLHGECFRQFRQHFFRHAATRRAFCDAVFIAGHHLQKVQVSGHHFLR